VFDGVRESGVSQDDAQGISQARRENFQA